MKGRTRGIIRKKYFLNSSVAIVLTIIIVTIVSKLILLGSDSISSHDISGETTKAKSVNHKNHVSTDSLRMKMIEEIDPNEYKINLLQNIEESNLKPDIYTRIGDLVVAYHKAGDKFGKYKIGTLDSTFGSNYEFEYGIYMWSNNPIVMFHDDPYLKGYLILRDGLQKYYLLLTPSQIRTCFRKVFTIPIDYNSQTSVDYYGLDPLIHFSLFAYFRNSEPSAWVKTPLRKLHDKDYKMMKVNEVVALDDSPLNTAAIEGYVKWLNDTFGKELLSHPAPDNRFPWERPIPK